MFVSETISSRLREASRKQSENSAIEKEAADAIDRLIVLLSHAVKEADEWHDADRGGPIEGDPLIYEARSLVMMIEGGKK